MTLAALKRKWTPHPGQQTVIEDDHRYRIVCCGRRWGKSEMAAHLAFEFLWTHPGADVWWVAPTYDDAHDYGYDKLVPIIPEAALDGQPKRSPPRKITLTNGASISFRSAEREDSLRGAGLSFLIIDEAGSVPNHAWDEELRPTLLDEQAPMLAIGTPKGKNWFYAWHTKGGTPDESDVNSWRSPTYDNPHIPDDEIDSAREEMPEREFDQELLAKFVDEAGGVFSGVRDNIAPYTLDAPADGRWTGGPDAGKGVKFQPPYAIGVDLARTQNYAVTIALDQAGQVAAFHRTTDTTWTQIQHGIEQIADHCSPATLRVDATRDNKLVQDLERSGLAVEPVNFGGGTKQDLIENLAVRLEQGGLAYPEIPELINELNLYEFDTTPAGNIRYGAPEAALDDIVDALALAARDSTPAAGTW